MPDSQRNALIEDFNHGVVHPDYEVILNKDSKEKYTVRKRKVSLPIKKNETPKEESPAKKEDIIEEEFSAIDNSSNPFTDDENYIPKGMKQGQIFREMQMQMNRMLLEQMTMIRQQQKY
jgi:hypothetical protein